MGKSAPTPPPAPDPSVIIGAQSQANTDTARLQAQLNNVNSYDPSGSVVYNQDPDNQDRWSRTTTLAPDQQRIFDLSNSAQVGALGVANEQVGRVGDALATPFNTAGLPALATAPGRSDIISTPSYGAQRSTFDMGQGVQGQIPGAGQGMAEQPALGPSLQRDFRDVPVQLQMGPTDFTKDREAVTNAEFARARSLLDPVWNTGEDRLHTRLSNQGFSGNSAGTSSANMDFNRDRSMAYNDAAFRAVASGAEEQQRLFDEALSQGQFANDAAGQQFGQNRERATFGNQADLSEFTRRLQAAQFQNDTQLQRFGEDAAAGQFANDAAGQQYAQGQGAAAFENDATNAEFQNRLAYSDFYNNAGQRAFDQDLAGAQFNNQSRQQGVQERAYQSQLPINELSALLGLGQVSMPQGIQYSPIGVNPTDAVGGYGVASNAATQRYAAQAAAQAAMNGSLFGGLAKLGSAAIGVSDRRLKRDIKPLSMLKGLGVYLFRYLWSDDWQIGVMAQEALRVRPDIVRVHPSGFLMVDYGAI